MYTGSEQIFVCWRHCANGYLRRKNREVISKAYKVLKGKQTVYEANNKIPGEDMFNLAWKETIDKLKCNMSSCF